jgi:hypothetical protein
MRKAWRQFARAARKRRPASSIRAPHWPSTYLGLLNQFVDKPLEL